MVSDRSLKFLCSYGGKIVIRQADGKLRYQGGHTRVLSVDRSISYTELMVKLGEFCGYSVELRCQLPGGDLETLISIKSDEELKGVIEEYDRSFPDLKIRAILSPPTSLKTVSPPTSKASSIDYFYCSPKSPFYSSPCSMSYWPPIGFPVGICRDYGNATGNGRLKERFCYDSRCCKNWH